MNALLVGFVLFAAVIIAFTIALIVVLVVVGTRQRRQRAVRADSEGVVLDTGWTRMDVWRGQRRTNAPDRLVLTQSGLELVAGRSRTENADFSRLRAWVESSMLRIDIAPDPRIRTVEPHRILAPVHDPARWLIELGRRGALCHRP